MLKTLIWKLKKTLKNMFFHYYKKNVKLQMFPITTFFTIIHAEDI